MTRTLITGGAGFIGFRLASLLIENGHHVDLVDNFARGIQDPALQELAQNPNVTLKTYDLLETDFMQELAKEYDYIYHLAAIIGVENVLNRPFDVLKDNTQMLLNMIDFAKHQQHLQRFVFASTSEVYAGTLKHFDLPLPTPETTPLALPELEHPRTSYMLSKIYGEALCQHSGLPFTLVRPHNFYGPRMGLAHVIPQLLQKIHNAHLGEDLAVFSTEHKRTFCYIDDAVEMMRLLAESESGKNGTFNIGNESPEVTMGELAELLTEVSGKSLNISPQPPTPGSPERRCPQMKHTFDAIQYTPKFSLKDGVQACLEWYRPIFDGQGVSAK